ncbi:FHA domain-containing protein [Candidatus Poriferisocius sp.]|uniref:FHA domain-containing protein n=1 Tax=Candidatus Poriferisocius sp. TaxID=3101276 RepID=UPI003B017E43
MSAASSVGGSEAYCPMCGYRSGVGANFCAACGNRLTSTGDGGAAHSSEEPTTEMALEVDLIRQPAVLVVTQGAAAGSRFELAESRVSLGRHPDSDIFLDDITVSRTHAEIYRDGLVPHVKDMGSLNGTYLNSRRVEEAGLKDGDELQIGRFKLVFHDRIGW